MGGSILLPNWSAYSGTPSQMVALKVAWFKILKNILKKHACCYKNQHESLNLCWIGMLLRWDSARRMEARRAILRWRCWRGRWFFQIFPFFGVFLLQILGDSFKSFHSWEFFSLQFLQILCDFFLFSGDFFNFCVDGLWWNCCRWSVTLQLTPRLTQNYLRR